MKVFLDDERDAPDGWVKTRWPNEVIALLQAGLVEELSLDHDLGDDERGTGYDGLKKRSCFAVLCHPRSQCTPQTRPRGRECSRVYDPSRCLRPATGRIEELPSRY